MTPRSRPRLELWLALPLLIAGLYAWWQGQIVVAALLLPAAALCYLMLRQRW
jgi:hypothetical protein